MITSLQIAWAAGIYEGEGSVTVPTKTSRGMAVSIFQKDPWLPLRFQSLFGGHIYRIEQRGQSGAGWLWRLGRGAEVRGFLLTIYTFLSPRRRERIREALAADRYRALVPGRRRFKRAA